MFRTKSDPIPPPEVLNDRLEHIGGLTQEDLEANRAGRMSEAQQAGYARMMGSTNANQSTMMIIYLVVFILVMAGVGIAFQSATGEIDLDMLAENSTITVIGIGGSLLLYLGFVGYAIYRSRKMMAQNPEDIVVHSVSGKIQLSRVDPGTGRKLRDGDKKYGYSVVKVKGKQLYARNPVVYKALVDGAEYRVYYINSTGRFGSLISAEAI